jgi:hypothetical protein
MTVTIRPRTLAETDKLPAGTPRVPAALALNPGQARLNVSSHVHCLTVCLQAALLVNEQATIKLDVLKSGLTQHQVRRTAAMAC